MDFIQYEMCIDRYLLRTCGGVVGGQKKLQDLCVVAIATISRGAVNLLVAQMVPIFLLLLLV